MPEGPAPDRDDDALSELHTDETVERIVERYLHWEITMGLGAECPGPSEPGAGAAENPKRSKPIHYNIKKRVWKKKREPLRRDSIAEELSKEIKTYRRSIAFEIVEAQAIICHPYSPSYLLEASNLISGYFPHF